MTSVRFLALFLLLCGVAIGLFAYAAPNSPWVPDRLERFTAPFRLGLDLSGGSHLVYRADVTEFTSATDVEDAMNSLREVIERRVNLFGVAEPLVQVEQGGIFGTAESEQRLIVELPGVTDINKAIASIGETPLLEFKTVRPGAEALLEKATTTPPSVDEVFISTSLTGRFLEKAQLEFDQQTNEPKVVLLFNEEGSKLFEEITRANVGKIVAIVLDGEVISAPVVRQEISGGRAEISGGFTPTEARDLARNLNFGALPVKIELLRTQTIGPSLGANAMAAGLLAGMVGFLLVATFLIVWYRLPGVIASLALIIYVAINLALFKLIPVTLTAAGIAAFILSIGMAVDANILIFERTKEELKRGKNLHEAVREGFSRAWLSIRDSNISSIITAIILFWFGTTALIKGFALVFGLGVLVSMFTAISVSRTLLLAVAPKEQGRASKFLFGHGLGN